jgi:sugar O-acyltransferase (sialic acid O-acetyltransferase NeuD family)
MADLVIFGAGEGARLAGLYFHEEGRHRVVGYTVDDGKGPDRFLDRQVVDFVELEHRFPPGDVLVFVALGFRKMNRLRRSKFEALLAKGYDFATYVHPSNIVPPETTIGRNCFILANQCIDRGVSIGDNVTVWSGCHIGDRSRIADHAWLSSHVCLNGDVTVGEQCFLASNCCISPGVHLMPRSFIGANSLITQNTEEGAVHVVPTTPAQPMDSERFMALMRNF